MNFSNKNYSKSKWQSKNFIESFGYAINGLKYSFITQRNLKIQLVFALFAIIFGLYLKLSYIEFSIIIFAIMFVLFTEMANTVMETLVDLYTEEFNEKAKIAKDISAGAVLIASLNSIFIGILIFLPKIIKI